MPKKTQFSFLRNSAGRNFKCGKKLFVTHVAARPIDKKPKSDKHPKFTTCAAVEFYTEIIYDYSMENKPTYERTSRELRNAAVALVHKCGLRADLKGSDCLTDAISIFAEKRADGFCEIYRKIADARGLKPKSVLRGINYALSASRNLHIRLSEITGLEFTASDVHASMIIALLARLINSPELISKGNNTLSR